ncbi:MAG: aminomethyl-transferring glycine dehydrogenase subunit GcvPB [Candidatus Omnitrophota bacterium]|nr:aminomethyl-transferring glycine dehydrogenase subunit GcvPB [Candidatus Omnitrophota bacterium]
MELIFEESVRGRKGLRLPKCDVPQAKDISGRYKREKPAQLPEVSELDVVRHFTRLSRMNFSVDTHFYPLGSCTMKYNPKFTENIAKLTGFSQLHPLLPQLLLGGMLTQGALEVLYNVERLLVEITGMTEVTTEPLAGAHGELTGMMLIAAYHRDKGSRKKYVIVPDSSHGTNPASAAIAGYQTISIPTDKNGVMDFKEYKNKLNSEVAGLMLTCPNTVGIFNSQIKEICSLAHRNDALVYYDGANLNAILGKVRPGDIGFDIVHLNLHKTFATPHGSGGPGSGPVGVRKDLTQFLPVPKVIKRPDGTYALEENRQKSIGRIASFYGNFDVLLKTYAYILLLGKTGLIEVSEKAVLNANYIAVKLKKYYDLAYDRICMHECVFSATRQLANGVHALDIAKALIDRGFHPPTIYFPLIVKEAMMIEPTESESKHSLDRFIAAMRGIAELSQNNPEVVKSAPLNTAVSRPDETKAARELNLRWIA